MFKPFKESWFPYARAVLMGKVSSFQNKDHKARRFGEDYHVLKRFRTISRSKAVDLLRKLHLLLRMPSEKHDGIRQCNNN